MAQPLQLTQNQVASLPTKTAPSKLVKRYLIAVDFGTTYSGLAWAAIQQHGGGRPRIISQWPAGGTSEKTPTTIRYHEDSSGYSWGSEVDEHMPKHEWFKLGLEPTHHGGHSRLAEKYPPLVPAPGIDVEPERLVVDYLGALRTHAQSKLEATLKNRALADRQASIEYVLTIPAMWSEKARELTRKCASDAGMGSPGRIKVITEPEAAAIWELKERASSHDLSEGDTFVLCDAGGGTVDLISYTVKELQPPVVEEATSGSGGSCGSTFINRVFAKWLKSHLGDHPYWDDEILFAAVDEFDRMKKTFNPKKDKKYMIRLPKLWNEQDKNISKGMLDISKKQMAKIFEPVATEVIDLVKQQIHRTNGMARTVLLVGGFGQSIYLKDKLQEAVPKGIKVVQGVDPISAVVMGAALYGLQESSSKVHFRLESRKARQHYGIEAIDKFQPGVHDYEKKFRDNFTGGYKIDIMNWIIRKEEPIQPSHTRKFPLFYESRVSNGIPPEITTKIYACSSDKAPLYKDSTVMEHVELTADLRSIAANTLNREPGMDGHEYYKLDFEIEMKCFSVVTEYALVYQGKRHKVIKADYV